MATILSMPKWGLSMKSGLVVGWLKRQGESVQEGEPLVQIESEKATNDVEAPAAGTLRSIVVPEGESTDVSEPIAVITAPGEELSDEQVAVLLREDAEMRRQKAAALMRPRAATKTPATGTRASVRAPVSTGGRVNASPAARRLAQELGIDLATVTGTGTGGMVGREDVLLAAEEAKASAEEAEEQVIEVGGIATHYLVAGPINASRIVFVHGLGGSLTTWALNLPAFAQQFRICALDLAGAGSSDKPTMDYSVPSLADFLACFLDTLGSGWQRVSIVGHSLGGTVALAFAEHYPQRIEQLVLVDSAGLGPEIDNTVLNLVRTEPTPEHIRAELACFFANVNLVQQALVDQVYQQRMLPGAREALLATTEAAFGGGRQRIDLREMLAVLRNQVLVVWGTADGVIPVAHAQEATRARQSRLEVFTDCGHCPHIERSDAFNQLVVSFLSGI